MKFAPILIAFLALAILTPTSSHAEQVLYCSETASVGFSAKTGTHQPAKFEVDRYTASFNENTLRLQASGDAMLSSEYVCDAAYGNAGHLSCKTWSGDVFNYDIASRRFVLTSAYGYVFGGTDSVSVSIGTCADF